MTIPIAVQIMNATREDQYDSILLEIAKKLVLAKQELDELAIQLSLGKIEAKDKFEEIKQDFSSRLGELKQAVQDNSQGQATLELLARIVALETALCFGKADNHEVFDTQKRIILGGITRLGVEIKKFSRVPAIHDFIHDIEKFKLKIEIIRLKFLVKKFKIKDAFHTGMEEAVDVVRTAGSKIRKARARYRNFRDELRQAYSHMKKAVKRM